MRDSAVRGSLSKVIDSLAAGYPFSIVHLLEFENRRRILFKRSINVRHEGSEFSKLEKSSFGCERVDCTVRNLSVTGAMIEVETSDVIPHEIILDILGRGARFHCHVVWRHFRRLGVAFD